MDIACCRTLGHMAATAYHMHVYVSTPCRASPYLIGLAAGWYLRHLRAESRPAPQVSAPRHLGPHLLSSDVTVWIESMRKYFTPGRVFHLGSLCDAGYSSVLCRCCRG